MKVLVTGGSGFLGQRLLLGLIASGFSVRATHRRAGPRVTAAVEWWALPDLDDTSALDAAVAGSDAIIHLAALAHQPAHAERAPEFLRVNRDGTRRLARAAAQAGVPRFILVSSIAAICTNSDKPVDDCTVCAPTDAYGYSKLEAERALTEELVGTATDWCILRPPLVYGPGNPGNMRRLLHLIGSGVPLPFGAIRNRRSFIFLDNLVDAMLTVLRYAHATCSTYVVSDGSDLSTPELVDALATALGRKARLLPVPIAMLRAAGRAGDVVNTLLHRRGGLDSTAVDRLVGSLLVDGVRFNEAFGWRPPVPTERALELTGRAFSNGGRK